MNIKTTSIINAALSDLDSNKEKLRNKAYNTLLPISESSPEKLYPEWDKLVKILNKKEVSNKYVVIPLIANLTLIDNENKFDGIFTMFYDLLNHESPVVSPHIAGQSGKIIKNKPYLQEKILEKLLSTDKYSECRHKELLKSYVIDALTDCFHVIKNKEKVLQFVKGQINSDSPKTKNRAKEFLKKFYEK
ncbi:MAG: hypothetical protein P8Y81_06875 [Ignavibacteriaceae bacterium]